jgi:hypothetical protein
MSYKSLFVFDFGRKVPGTEISLSNPGDVRARRTHDYDQESTLDSPQIRSADCGATLLPPVRKRFFESCRLRGKRPVYHQTNWPFSCAIGNSAFCTTFLNSFF